VSGAVAAAAAVAGRRYPHPVRRPASRGYLYTAAGRRYTTLEPQPGSAVRLARRLLRKTV